MKSYSANINCGSVKLFTIATIAVLCLLVIVISALAFSYHERSKKVAAAYASLQKGDSRERIIQVLGKPDEIERCQKVDLSTRVNELPFLQNREECVEIYWYLSFLERWGFSLSADGKIMNKAYNVSY